VVTVGAALIAVVSPAQLAGATGPRRAHQQGALVSTFTGKTKMATTLTFRASSSAVSDLRTSLDVLCLTAYPSSKSAIQVVAVAPKTSAPLQGGTFTFSIPAPLPRPSSRERTTVTGRVSGTSASGTMKSFFDKTWLVYDPGTGMYVMAVASCAGSTTWTASRK
jgi:hypothetical protein